MPDVTINAVCKNCTYWNNGCAPDDPDPYSWCPSWEIVVLDPDEDEEEEEE